MNNGITTPKPSAPPIASSGGFFGGKLFWVILGGIVLVVLVGGGLYLALRDKDKTSALPLPSDVGTTLALPTPAGVETPTPAAPDVGVAPAAPALVVPQSSSPVVLADLCPRADDREAFLLCLDTIFIPAVIKKQDPVLCDQITDEELRENCQDQYITRQAFALQDIARCDNASDPALCRMIYMVNQAIRQKDSGLCKDVPDEKLQSECKGIIEGTFSPPPVPERK